MPSRKSNRRRRRRRRRKPRVPWVRRQPMRRRVVRMRRRGIPAAVQKGFRPTYSMKRVPGGVLVRGRDLVQPLPEAVAAYDNYFLFTAITANPCYWTGTKIAAIAAAYQCFRPLHWRASFIPQVAVTQAGTVMTGTNWYTITSTNNFQQSMVTSNGGAMSQCYVPFDTRVKLGTNLQQNMYNCSGPLDTDHNPFNFMAFMKGANVIPGYFYVSYAYIFKNPIGQAVNYSSRRTVAPDYGLPTTDKSIMLLGPIANFTGPGLTLDVESNGVVLYNNSEVAVPDGLPIIVYDSTPAGGVVMNREARSILATDIPQTIGNTYTGISDYSVWDWNTDTTTSKGFFAPTSAGGRYGFGWYLEEGLSRLSAWADSVVGMVNLYFYAVDTATKVIGALIVAQKAISGTRNSPTAVFTVEPYNLRRGPLITRHEVVKLIKQMGSRMLRTSADSDSMGARSKAASAAQLMEESD